jgi:hypothetical protein
MFAHRTQILELAAKQKLPTMHPQRQWVEDGGLISYGPNFPDLSRRAATYVDISKHVGRVNCSRVLAG